MVVSRLQRPRAAKSFRSSRNAETTWTWSHLDGKQGRVSLKCPRFFNTSPVSHLERPIESWPSCPATKLSPSLPVSPVFLPRWLARR